MKKGDKKKEEGEETEVQFRGKGKGEETRNLKRRTLIPLARHLPRDRLPLVSDEKDKLIEGQGQQD
jgi:hypothetical protein